MDFNGIIERCGSERMLTQGVLLSEVLLLLYGIFLLVFPAQALTLSVGFIGIVMILAGLAAAIMFLLNRDAATYVLLALAAIGVIVGIIVLFFRGSIALILFPIILGLWTLISTVWAAFSALANRRVGNGLWWIPLLAAVVGAVVTVLIFMNLSGTERFMARILGIYFITYNIVRLGEFGALRLAPTESPARRRRSGASRRSYREREDDRAYDEGESYDVYDYEENRSYAADRVDYDDYDYDRYDDRYDDRRYE